jgi:hypothetical protein
MMTSHQKTINVNRETLIKALEANLADHRKEYREAVENYRIAVMADLEAALNDMERAKTDNEIRSIQVKFHFPMNYESQYVEAIDMLKFSVDENIQIDQQTFQSYVKNEWAWTNGFKALNSTYSAAVGGRGR